jgi:two-component system sensor histidine kinase RegB
MPLTIATETSPPDIGSTAKSPLRRLVVARWWVLAAAAALFLAAPWLLDIRLSLWPLLGVTIVAALWNAFSHWRLGHTADASSMQSSADGEIFSQICFDLIVLSAWLFFSGGATNPLVFMLLPPVAVAALLLPQRLVAAVATIAVVAYSVLMVNFIPLPLADPARAAGLHLSGMWVTFVVSVGMISWFILRMTEALRQRDAELAAAREQALRDERVLALGTLAASAAHELGTPLATLTLLADELEHDARLGAEAHADLQLMREQIAYCKRIITGLTERAGAGRAESAEALPCDEWLRKVFDTWRDLRGQPDASLAVRTPARVGDGMTAVVGEMASPEPPPPRLVAEISLEHGVHNLLDNAVRAGAPVEVGLDWNESWLTVSIRDHGGGFSADDLQRAGREAFAAHSQGGGVGLLLTRAAVERHGGHLRLGNVGGAGAHGNGALVQIVLPVEDRGARYNVEP